MPLKYRVDKSLGVVFSIADGVLDIEDCIQLKEALRSDPDFQSSFDQFLDLTKIVDCRLTPGELNLLAAQPLFSKDSRRVFVAPNDLVYGLSRMYQAFMEDHDSEIAVFRDRSEAMKWMGLEETDQDRWTTLPARSSVRGHQETD